MKSGISKKEISKIALIAATSAIVLLLTSCQAAANRPYNYDHISSGTYPIDSITETGSPQKTYSEGDGMQEKETIIPATVINSSSEANAEATAFDKDKVLASDDHLNDKSKSWNAKSPSLHGISIGDDSKKITKLFGEEEDSYTLKDEAETISVHEYIGFAVGINRKNTVQYVEVYDQSLSIGLNGLMVGDAAEEAVKLLGKPDKQTTYLLTYHAEGAFLKLDLDPAFNEIISIKLLAKS